MRKIFFILVLVLSGSLSAQVSVNGGGSTLFAFGNKKPFGGVHIGLEIPRDDAVSIFGKFTHHFKQRGTDSIPNYAYSIDLVNIPPTGYQIPVNALPTMNYNILEGGTRYYLGNGFDYGFAGYGGTSIMLVFNTVKAAYSPYNESLYEIDDASRFEGSIFSIGFGLGGGVKYSMARLGTLYLDINVAYMIFSQPSNSGVPDAVYSNFNQQWSPLIFNLNLGFRKDIIW